MGDTKISNQNWFRHEAEAIQLSNSKGAKADRIDVTKLGAIVNKDLDSKVNNQYLIALASDEIVEEHKDIIYKPFWDRQVAVRVGEGTDGKIQYALLNRNSLIKRLSMDEAKLNESIEAGNVHEYIATRLKELSHIKSCFREANPMPNSKGDRQLRLDLAEQFPSIGIGKAKIRDERSQLCVAMSQIKVREEADYCAGWGELAVKVGTTENKKNEFAILNKNSLLNRLCVPEKDRTQVWETLKEAEKSGTADVEIKNLMESLQLKQGLLRDTLRSFLNKEVPFDNPTILNDTKALLNDFHLNYEGLEFNKNEDGKKFIDILSPQLWWTTFIQGAKPPAQISLKEPTIISDWDESGRYTISAVSDFIDTERVDIADLETRGEVPMHCIFDEGTSNEVRGWVTYKIEDLKRLGFRKSDFEKYSISDNFQVALHERLDKIKEQNEQIADGLFNWITILKQDLATNSESRPEGYNYFDNDKLKINLKNHFDQDLQKVFVESMNKMKDLDKAGKLEEYLKMEKKLILLGAIKESPTNNGSMALIRSRIIENLKNDFINLEQYTNNLESVDVNILSKIRNDLNKIVESINMRKEAGMNDFTLTMDTVFPIPHLPIHSEALEHDSVVINLLTEKISEMDKDVSNLDTTIQHYLDLKPDIKDLDFVRGTISYLLPFLENADELSYFGLSETDLMDKNLDVNQWISNKRSIQKDPQVETSPAHSLSGSKGEEKLRLDIGKQFSWDEDVDIKGQFRIAMERPLVLEKDPAYCAKENELAVKIGNTDKGYQYAVLNKESLLYRLGVREEYHEEAWKDLKIAEDIGTAHVAIKLLFDDNLRMQSTINEILSQPTSKPLARHERQVLFLEFYDFIGRYFNNNTQLRESVEKFNDNRTEANQTELVKLLTPLIWWEIPPSQIVLKNPTISFEWDKEGKYSLSAVSDFIYTEEPDQEALREKGEIALHSSFFDEEKEGWVIYKLQDLKRILGDEIQLEPFTKKGQNFLAAFREIVNLQSPAFGGIFDLEETDVNALINPSATSVSPTATKLLEAYNSPEEGWVIVPPKDLIKTEEAFAVGSGAIGFEGNGRWKIHVSIDPTQMEQAIPIIAEVLHSENAPRLGFKMQTKANLDSVHQIGKELAIIFDKQVEETALKGDLKGVQDCLDLLWKKLKSAGIRPEAGFVLTPQTMSDIKKAPKDSQVMEKQNLERGKFDRAIPCPEGRNFFYYRDENFAPMLDSAIGDLKGLPGVYAASEIIDLARKKPDLAHNPTGIPDPFLNLKIQNF